MNPKLLERFATWVAEQPECVQRLAAEFPPPHTFTDKAGNKLYLLGYTEGDELILTPIDPTQNYEFAKVCAIEINAERMRQALKEAAGELN